MSAALSFTKMHGAGNDFIVLDGLVNGLTEASLTDGPFTLSSTMVMRNEAGAGG